MNKAPIILIILFTIARTTCPAAEVDTVTSRGVVLDSSLQQLNAIINSRIIEGINNANDDSDSKITLLQDTPCDEEELYDELRRAIFQSFGPGWGLRGYALDKQLRDLLAENSFSLSLNDSIYRDINYLEGFSLRLKELSDIVRIDDQLIGLDKIGHFFAEGWQYFELIHFDEKTLTEALAAGREMEQGKFGYTTTGIFSYADLVANFHGYRFWNRVLLKQRDPLKGAITSALELPYVECRLQFFESVKQLRWVRAWERIVPFDLSDYIDGSWDETNNCNSYKDPVIEEKIASRSRDVEPSYSCPNESSSCVQAQYRYGKLARELLHPACLTAQLEK